MDCKFCNREKRKYSVETACAMFVQYLLTNPEKNMTNKTISLGNALMKTKFPNENMRTIER